MSSGKGLVLLDPLWSAAAQDVSGVDQLGLEVELPEPDAANVGTLELRQLGTPTAGHDLELFCVEGGRANDRGRGASVVWRRAGDGDSEWRGHLSPMIPLDLQQAASSGAYPAAAGLRSGRIVLLWKSGSGYSLTGVLLDADGTRTAVTAATLPSPGSGVVAQLATGLAVAPGPAGERLIAVCARPRGADPEPQDLVTLTVLISDDEGETWATVVEGAAGWARPADNLVTGLRVAYHRGSLVALVAYGDSSGGSWVAHLVSADLGASWELVATADASTGITDAHPVSTDAGLFFLWVNGSRRAAWAVLGSPYEDALANAAAAPDGAGGPQAEWSTLAVGRLEDGRIALVGRALAPNEQDLRLIVVEPTDPANNPTDPRCNNLRGLLDTTDSGENLCLAGSVPPVVAFAGGRGVLLSTCESQLHPSGGPLLALFLGGPSTPDWRDFTYGKDYRNVLLGGVVQAGAAWLPISSPQTWAGWTVTASASTVAVSAASMRLTDGSGTSRWQVARTMVTGLSPLDYPRRVAWARVKVDGGPTTLDTTAGGRSMIGLRFDEDDYIVELAITKTAAAVIDRVAGVSLGQIALPLTGEHELLLMLTDTAAGGDLVARGWAREAGADLWTEIGGGTLTAGSGLGGADFAWGHLASSSAGGRDSYWGPVYLSGHTESSQNYAGGRLLQCELGASAWPGHLSGRALTTAPAFLDDGRAVAGRGGVALEGDAWTLPARWAAGAWRSDPAREPSPAAAWQTGTTNAQALVWETGEVAFTSTSVGLVLMGTNVGQATLQRWDGAAWVDVISADRRSVQLSWTRLGNVLTPAAGNTVAWWSTDELVGSWIDLGPVHGVRAVRENREGAWSVSAPLVTQVQLEGDVSTLPSSGTCRVIWRDTVHLVHDVTPSASRWRLSVASGQRVVGDGYVLGVVGLGVAALFGAPYEWGRQQQTAAQVDVIEAADGTRRTKRRGAPRRRVDFSWEALDERAARAGAPAVLTPASGSAVAVDGDPHQMEGLLRRLDGPSRLVVYLPAVDLDASTEALCGPARLLYGRMVSPVTRRTVLGEELSDEVIAVDAVVIEEEV
jgi:hypothetical protein